MLTTIGNYPDFATHRLEVVEASSPTAAAGGSVGGDCACPAGIREAFAQNAAFRAPPPSPSDDEYLGNTKLTRIAASPQAISPFIVVRADRRVISDHADIWRRPFVEFMASLITRTDALLPR